ncbi:aromatase/cyclase [Streptomyces spectabilis]|uniref:Aromatase n=1 Tax=Streptomyces spectabilis TaxID=68270 RepID=A0A5P2X801_STRST|nr:aromatase/cyclase [Streptomyces spectabilis]MBB5106821.1 aromatase [Streptomyces spectabilis]MCI3903328.1 aromatase/cyclase [Streptomyces spectabilis]QEV60551.1 cyclase [Streptomyces spectabilis]GGV44049.1 actinorhodin polyketide synthase bifunctional cyclase/dehydratase [Streptomyces spectabilis]
MTVHDVEDTVHQAEAAEGGHTVREVEHEITVSAPADAVYRLIADVENWPRIFPPTVHVERVEGDDREERIRIWATGNGEVKHWTSRRVLDRAGLRVDFRQEVSTPPVAAMGGAWIIENLPSGQCRVRLLHDYRAVDAAGLAWLDEAVDRNSRTELAALKENAERGLAAEDEGLLCSFEDAVRIDGTAKDVYDFINEAHLWPERLPHVDSVRLDEPVPGLQTLEMDTRSKDGSAHTTKSHRVTFPHRKIAYKQITLPALMTLHTGYWTFTDTGSGVTASSQHTFVLDTGNVARVLGPDATTADAVAYVRTALSTNSLATLGAAKAYAESRG